MDTAVSQEALEAGLRALFREPPAIVAEHRPLPGEHSGGIGVWIPRGPGRRDAPAMPGRVEGRGEDVGRVLEAFRRLYRADAAKGNFRTLHDYQALFPGYWDAVAEEHERLGGLPTVRHAAAAPPTPGGTGRPGTRAPSTEERVGPYRILRELGRGGMGVVYLAEDTRLRRRVALKLLSPLYASSEDLQARFQREAAIASRLDHPGICTVYEAGQADGVPFIAMRYLEGETLDRWLAAARAGGPDREGASAMSRVHLPAVPATEAGGREPPGRRRTATGAGTKEEIQRIVYLVERVAHALHAAHEAGLIHRDIKPGNVLITREGEPVLLDFGLAREEGAGSGLTQTGALMGTPAYMSPEQLAAQRIRLDRRTDVYSLGVTLYECLTLRPPFEAETRDALYQKILVSAPPDPRRLNPALPADLKVVLETAMEKDRDRRYATALLLAEDLRRVRVLEPIHARPIGFHVRLQRWAQRNPALAASLGSLLLLAAAAPPAWTVLQGRLDEERGKVEDALMELQAVKMGGDPLLAQSLWEKSGNLRRLGQATEAKQMAAQILGMASDTKEVRYFQGKARKLIDQIEREGGR